MLVFTVNASDTGLCEWPIITATIKSRLRDTEIFIGNTDRSVHSLCSIIFSECSNFWRGRPNSKCLAVSDGLKSFKFTNMTESSKFLMRQSKSTLSQHLKSGLFSKGLWHMHKHGQLYRKNCKQSGWFQVNNSVAFPVFLSIFPKVGASGKSAICS